MAKHGLILNNQKESRIKVTETHMSTVIDQYLSDDKMGFAHSISADFDDPKHMSAGVAVVFKELFGKPTLEDRLTSHLTIQ